MKHTNDGDYWDKFSEYKKYPPVTEHEILAYKSLHIYDGYILDPIIENRIKQEKLLYKLNSERYIRHKKLLNKKPNLNPIIMDKLKIELSAIEKSLIESGFHIISPPIIGIGGDSDE